MNMNLRINAGKLMLYKNFKHQELFDNFEWLINNADDEYYNDEDKIALLYECVNELLELANSYGFEGNLYHNFLGFYWQIMRMHFLHHVR